MKIADFNKAIEILTAHHSSEIQINRCAENQQVSPILASPTIHITKCVPAVVSELIAQGFSLSMSAGALKVDKY